MLFCPVVFVGVSNVGAVEPESNAVYHLVVQNWSAVPVTDVSLAITLAPGWSFVDAEGDWHCTPEPATLVLLGGPVAGLLAMAWRRRRQRESRP